MKNILAIVILTAIWIILVESFEPIFVISGILASTVSVMVSKRFLPLKEIEDVSFRKLVFYPFFLVGQIYSGGFYVIKIILSGQRTDLVTIKTSLKSDVLRVILADTITLTPGSVLLDLTDDEIMVVWLRNKNAPDVELVQNKDELLKGNIEKMLFKAQK